MSSYDLRKEEILKDASELIKIKSITQDREQNKEALNWVLEKSIELGLHAGFAVEDEVVIVTFGFGTWRNMNELRQLISESTKENLGILAHVDVVPAEGIWTVPPFEGAVKDGCLWGRGAMDDKGPLVLCLHAMAELAKICKEEELTNNLFLVVGSREEEEWMDIEALNKLGIKADFGFTPDGEFPVSNREKGYLDIAFRFQRTAQDERYLLNGGSAANIIPEMAQLMIKGIEGEPDRIMEYHGTATHSSKPEHGENAIVKMAEGLEQEAVSETVKKIFRFLRESGKDYYGGVLNLDSGETVIGSEYFHRNVISPVQIKTLEEYYEIIFNMRSVWGYTTSKVWEELQKTALNWDAEVVILQSLDPIMVSRDSEFLKMVERVYKEETGEEFDFELAHGTSYAKAMPNIVALGPVFPFGLDTCHEVDERMPIDEFMMAGRIYWNVIKNSCSE